MTAETRDELGHWLGHQPRDCGDHRTVGEHRAWCHDCGEWCSQAFPCARCELPRLRAVEAAAARYVREGLAGSPNYVSQSQAYVALVEAVRTNPDFRG